MGYLGGPVRQDQSTHCVPRRYVITNEQDLAEGIAKLAKLHGALPNRGTLGAQSAERAGYVAVAKTQKPRRDGASEVTGVGLEPTTYGLKVRCSAN